MEGRHYRDVAVGLPGSAYPGNRDIASQQQARRGPTEGDDGSRLDGVDLAVEEGLAGGDLVALRGAIFWRSAFDDVADVDVTAWNLEAGLDHLGEQFAGSTHEGEAAAIFFLARSLADEHQ